MAHDAFLSYSYQDKAAADAICHSLEAKGVRCWIAPRDVVPGADWQMSIMEAITGAKAVILIFTAHTNQSDNVKKEISAAVDAGAVVIPFFIEDVKPEGALKFHLIGVHWLDAYAPPLEEHIAQLAKTIFSLSGHAPPPPPIAAPPLDVTPPTPPPAPPPPPPNPGFDPVAMWAAMSRDRKIAVSAVAALVVVSLIAVGIHAPRTVTNTAASSSAASASSAAAPSAAAPADSSAPTTSDSSTPGAAATTDDTNNGAQDRHVQVINQTEHAMLHFYASNIDRTSWEEDILGTSVLAPGESSNINIDDGTGHCLFDFKAVFDDNQSLVRHAVNVCTTRVYRYTEN